MASATPERCRCACHWLNRRTDTDVRFTHTEAHRCCEAPDVIVRDR